MEDERNRKRVMSRSRIPQNVEFRPDLRKDIKVAELMP